jgi:hypothetical protein
MVSNKKSKSWSLEETDLLMTTLVHEGTHNSVVGPLAKKLKRTREACKCKFKKENLKICHDLEFLVFFEDLSEKSDEDFTLGLDDVPMINSPLSTLAGNIVIFNKD